MRNPSTTGWLLRVAATCAVILAGCWVAPRFLGHIPEFPPITTSEQRFGILERFVPLPAPDIVLVGSSLTFHFKEGFFERGDIRNLALEGSSALTGLAIIEADKTRQPHVVAVETNILFPAVDVDLVELSKRLRHAQRWLQPVRTLAAAYQQSSDNKKQAWNESRTRSVLASPAETIDSTKGIARLLVQWDTPVFDGAVQKNLVAMKKLVEQLEARGVIVLFYELPVAPAMAHSHYADAARDAFQKIFGRGDVRSLELDYPSDQLRWTDGIHMDERSALIMSISLQTAIGNKLASMRGSRGTR